MPDVEAAAADLGIQLLPWQRRVAEAWLRHETVLFPTGKRAGKSTLQRVMHHAQNRDPRERAEARSERLLAVAEELGLARPEADFDIATGRPLAGEWVPVIENEPTTDRENGSER